MIFLLNDRKLTQLNPDDEILNYIKYINDILFPDETDYGYRFSILVHIAITLMKDKYTKRENLMKYLYKNNDNMNLQRNPKFTFILSVFPKNCFNYCNNNDPFRRDR